MSQKRVSVLLVSLALATATVGLIATQAQAALRHIDGTVISKNTANQTFQIRTQGGSRLRITVNASTDFERIAGGFRGLRAGMSIEIEAKSTADGLLARQVEPRGGNGGGGDDHGGHGADDGPNHT